MTPKVRRDGRCVVCRGQRPFTPQRGVPLEAYTSDPFCSRKCAGKWYGTNETVMKKTKHGILDT